MEIKEFQTLVISQIIESSKELNEKYGQNTIASKNICAYGDSKSGKYMKDGIGNNIHCIEVEIDVAVTVTDTKSTEAGAKLSVASVFNVGGEKNKTLNNETTNRIKYSLPVILPTTKEG